MKVFNVKIGIACLSLVWTVALFLLSGPAFPKPSVEVIGHIQQAVRGVVRNESGLPLEGVTVEVVGTDLGTSTTEDGTYSIVLPGKTRLSFRLLGHDEQVLTVSGGTLDVFLSETENVLEELVVVGYGSMTKKDLTGSVSTLSSDDFNGGLMGSPEQLINGKSAGVQVLSNSGSPSAGSIIRVRGGASLSASNDPLIVLDGVPLEAGGISGNSGNFLSLINPNDIEHITILKDASATAIYGSRASNGVLLITTKKGKGDQLRFSVSSVLSAQQPLAVADMLDVEDFRALIDAQGNDSQKGLLGGGSTDWLDEVFQTAWGTDDNISATGKIAKYVPFRASAGYYNQQGALRTDNVERITGSLVLNPAFFEDHLKVTANMKGARNNNRFANTDAIWTALAFNPTQPIYSGNEQYGGYYESVDNAGLPATGANFNPLGLLNQEKHRSHVNRVIGNLDVDYKFHFLPQLKAHVTLGYDYAKGAGFNHVPAPAAHNFTIGGAFDTYEETLKNRLFTGYLNYNRELPSLKSDLELTVGHDYQHWSAIRPPITYYNDNNEIRSTAIARDQRHTLLSLYGRLNYSYDSRYLLTATVRRDGTSRFSPENRWGTFPSLALAWRLSEERLLEDASFLNDLKLRASYGVTGQQEGIGNYGYLPIYNQGTPYAQYRFGNQYHLVYRPSIYVRDLRWETTKAFNYGMDFALFQNRIGGAVEYYTRKTHDLLANVTVPAGTNFDQMATTNVGNIESHGVEFQLNTVPIDREGLRWELNVNATNQKIKVTNIEMVSEASSIGTFAGPEVNERGIQILTPGYEPYMFYVYKQMYDETGKPLEAVYADLNGDGGVNEGDLYRYQSPAPDWMFGFNTQVSYRRWTAATTLRAHVGNYVYNNTKMNLSAWETVQYVDAALNNLHEDYLHTGFQARQYYSDYYVENGSFLRMENISLGYNVGRVGAISNIRVGAVAQNVFVISKYSGIDPEVPNGFDSSFYPRSRTYSLRINLDF